MDNKLIIMQMRAEIKPFCNSDSQMFVNDVIANVFKTDWN